MPDDTASQIDILRRMPAERRRAYCVGIESLFRWRPDLRRMYSAADLAFIRQGAGQAGPERYAKEGERLDYARDPSVPYKWSSTQFNLDEASSKAVIAFGKKIPDDDLADDGREDRPHVTVKYGLHTEDPDEVREVVEGFGPVSITLGKMSLFAAKEGSDYDVIKIDVAGDDIFRLNKLISDELECTDKHTTYKPHVTIAYVKPGAGKKYLSDTSLDGKTMTLKDLIFSSKKDKSKTVINLGESRRPGRYAKADTGDLARLYAAMLNDKLDAGLPVTTGDLDAIDAELATGRWRVDYSQHAWTATDDALLMYAAARAPKGGVTIAGKSYRGGQWIPGSVMDKASDAVKAKITGAAEKHKQVRVARGPVNREALAKKLAPHKGHTLTATEQRAASRSLRMLRDHHGDLTLHRIEELVAHASLAHDAASDPATKRNLSRRLKMLHTMMDEEVGQNTIFSAEKVSPAVGDVDVPALLDRLKPFENTELNHGDVMAAVARWEAIQRDYGDFTPHHLEDMADAYLKEIKEKTAALPKGARETRERIVGEASKQLAILSWMAERWQESRAVPEPNFAEALDRISYGERARSGKTKSGEKSTSPWTSFLLNAIAAEYGTEMADAKARDYVAPEQVWQNLKQGKYFGPRMDKILKAMPREYGTMSQSQLRKVLPHLADRRATITPEIVRKVLPAKARAG